MLLRTDEAIALPSSLPRIAIAISSRDEMDEFMPDNGEPDGPSEPSGFSGCGRAVAIRFSPVQHYTLSTAPYDAHFSAVIFTDSTLSIGAAAPAAGLTVPVIST
jgi:hypothetical protein